MYSMSVFSWLLAVCFSSAVKYENLWYLSLCWSGTTLVVLVFVWGSICRKAATLHLRDFAPQCSEVGCQWAQRRKQTLLHNETLLPDGEKAAALKRTRTIT
mmetsp:Transcript_56337/g.120833  ORF Transcript_56337/g.120833 Transcript_56337/m.120833 type:complete len:101 (+) Transcript_56337:170-472(+)